MAGEIKQELALDASETIAVLEQLKTAFGRFEAALTGAGNTVEAFDRKAQQLDKALVSSANAVRGVTRIFEQTRTPLEAHNARMEKYGALLESGAINQELFNRAAQRSQATLDRQTGATRAAAAEQQKIASALAASQTPLQAHTARMATYTAWLEKGAIQQGQFEQLSTKSTAKLNQQTAAIARAEKGTNKWVLSWETLSRVIQTQAIVRGINLIRDAFEFAIESQLKFLKQITEIRSIDTRSFQQIATDVREISDAFNQPLSTVAEAQYEVLSNQFTTAADRVNILSAANKLAKTTEDDLVGSVNLLTGALNAYGEGSEQAEMRAAQFFRTVELGRIRADELGTALGRVQSLGNELGVSMEELQATMATLTIGGVKYSEAGTQLRGMLRSLLKPSKEMKEALDELGGATGEQAIRTFGLRGAFEAVAKTTDGTSAALGKLAPNIRGAAGLFRVLGQGAEAYTKALRELENVDLDEFTGKATEAMSTDAARLQAEMNKLRNFFTAEFGADLVHALNVVVSRIGGADGLVGVLRTVTRDLPLLTVAIGGSIVALRLLGSVAKTTGVQVGFAATTGITGFQRFGLAVNSATKNVLTLRNAFLAVAAFEIGRILGSALDTAMHEWATRAEREAGEAFSRTMDALKRRQAAQLRDELATNAERFKAVRQLMLAEGVEFENSRHFYLKSMKLQVKDTKDAFNDILQARKRLTQDLRKAAEDSAKNEVELLQEVATLQHAQQDRAFNREIEQSGRSDLALQKYTARFKELTEQAAKLQEAVKDPEQQKLADAAWRRADAYKSLVESSAKATGNSLLQRRTEEALEIADGRRITSLLRNVELQKKAREELEKQAEVAEKNNQRLETAKEFIQEKLDEVMIGDLQPEEMKKKLAGIDQMIKMWVADVTKTTQGDFLQKFMGDKDALQKTQRDAERLLTGLRIKQLEVAPEAIQQLFDQLDKATENYKLKLGKAGVDVSLFEQAGGTTLQAAGTDELLTKAEDATKASIQAGAAAKNNAEQMDAAAAEYANTLQRLEETLKGAVKRRSTFASTPTEVAEARERSIRTFREIGEIVKGGQQLTDGYRKDLAKVVREVYDIAPNADEAEEAVKNAMAELDKMNEAAKVPEVPETQVAPEVLEQIIQQGEATRQKRDAQAEAANEMTREKDAAAAGKINIDSQFQSVAAGTPSVYSLAGAWAAVRDRAREAALAAAAATQAGSGGTAVAANGGLLRWLAKGGTYFDGGGFTPRGTDVFPAMLSPGEFVMNAASTRRFYSQLVAMNAGVQPRQQGGATNITVGDIHVNGTEQPRETAREVMRSIKRELRRGTSKW